ncbi:MAG TPA: PGPGW domain-containing protein [Thermodesulfobacteriota bacterium]|nr:PGPGW domain-containing protein [Thermodesulfobacteriota bacterium]
MLGRIFIHTLKQAKRVIIIVIGFTVLLFGIALIVLPGPAFIVIPAGLAILATEFLWAKRLLKQVKQRTLGMAAYLGWNSGNAPQGAAPGDKRDNSDKKKKKNKKTRKGNKENDKGQKGLSQARHKTHHRGDA